MARGMRRGRKSETRVWEVVQDMANAYILTVTRKPVKRWAEDEADLRKHGEQPQMRRPLGSQRRLLPHPPVAVLPFVAVHVAPFG